MARRSTHHLYARRFNRGGYIEILYYVRFIDWQKKRRVFPVGSSYETAKRLRDELLAKNVLWFDFDEAKKPKPGGIPFNAWLDECLKIKANKRAIRNYRMAAPKLREFFGQEAIGSIGADRVQHFKSWRYGQMTQYGRAPKPATVNREVALLKMALRLACKQGKLDKVPSIELDSENNKRDRVASEAEFRRILDGMPGFARDVVTVLYEQGMRIGEGCNLLRENVKIDENLIRLEGWQTKNGKPREMPITPVARGIIIQCLARKVRNVNARVFLDDSGNHLTRFQVYAYFKRACRKAGVTGLTPHDLRATFSTRKTIGEGHDRKLVMAIMGDTSDRAFDRYVRPSLDDLKKVMTDGSK